MSSSASGPLLPTLIVTGGASDGLQISLESPGAEKIIGSGPSSHLRLTNRNVDTLHARIAWEDAGVVLSDVGSAAGTFVNGERVETDQVLSDGDRISIGPPGSPESVKLLVRVPGNLAAVAAMRVNLAPPPSAAPSFSTADEDPLVFADPAVPETFTPAFAPPSAEPAADGPAIIFEESPAPPAPTVAAPAPAPTPPAPVPAPAPAPAGPVRTPRATPAARPDYMTEIPSISGGDRVREPLEVPAAEAPPARPAPVRRAPSRRTRLPAIPRAAVVAVAAAAVTAGAFYMYSHSRQPPPVLSSVTPPKAEVGSTITINGSGFEGSASDNTVRFGDAVATVTNASASSIAVTVPEVAVPAAKGIPITVEGKGGRSNALFVKIARLPRVTKVEPDVALPGTEVTLHGQHFDGGPVTVRVGGEKVEVKNASADSLQIRVPEMAWTDGQSVSVVVELGPDTARAMPLLMGRLPLVAEVAPAYGAIGQRVTIKGRGFDPVPTSNRVTIGGAPALVLAASANELQVAAPAAPTTGSQEALPLVVEAHGAKSSGRSTFALSHPLSGNARLRFYPAPTALGGDRFAFVSTEIGPVLVLTGKGDAATTAERADGVATGLTALVESAVSRVVTLEVREGASPAVAVAGGPVLVSVAAEDVEGYAQAWDPGLKPTRVNPRQIAAYWTALLQDYVTLFGQGQRPSRTAEMTPRGKVLVDLYAEAQRRGATGGVPVGILYELPPASLKDVREMALLIPSGGPSAAGVAVAGRWEGTMADTEAERSVEVQFQVDGGRLAGSLSTKTGGIAMRTPLQQVTYEKGVLKFLVPSGGNTRLFRAALEGGTLVGTIFKDAAGKDAVGRFSLRYVE